MHFSLMLDEMSIKHQVEWDGKEYHGFVDIGTELDDDELPEVSYALVFMIVSINGHFKIPVPYYLINGMTAIERGNLLNECLIARHEATIHIVSVTFDGAPTNISMVNHLGANIRPRGIINFFSHPISREKVYVLLDPCHMVKLVRNTLATKRTLQDEDGNAICWSYMEKLVNKQEDEGLHAATKIRRRHINWKNEKMKVQIAVQVFSTSVADALEYCGKDMKFSEFTGATPTAKFCRIINNVFDLLNSRNKFCRDESQQCIRDNLAITQDNVASYINYIEKLQVHGQPILDSNRKVGFLGLIVCLKSILRLAEQLLPDDMEFLLT